jgi:hypothetical protein
MEDYILRKRYVDKYDNPTEVKLRGEEGKYRKQFPTCMELSIAIDLYFMDCDSREVPYTIEGLCYALDMDRVSLLRYQKDQKDPERRAIVKRAKLKIQQNLLERGLSGKNGAAVTIFSLKNNYGYVDKQETESTVTVDNAARSELNNLSLDQLERIENIIKGADNNGTNPATVMGGHTKRPVRGRPKKENDGL